MVAAERKGTGVKNNFDRETAETQMDVEELIRRSVEMALKKANEHPLECRLGLDTDTVTTLKELASGYKAGKTKALVFMVKLIVAGLLMSAWIGLLQCDLKALLRKMIGG